MTMDDEANIFALYLLMPEKAFSEVLADGINLDDDRWLERVARKFRVPIAAVIARLRLENGRG